MSVTQNAATTGLAVGAWITGTTVAAFTVDSATTLAAGIFGGFLLAIATVGPKAFPILIQFLRDYTAQRIEAENARHAAELERKVREDERLRPTLGFKMQEMLHEQQELKKMLQQAQQDRSEIKDQASQDRKDFQARHDADQERIQSLLEYISDNIRNSARDVETAVSQKIDATRRILVVEDDDDNRLLMVDYLRRNGYDAVGADSLADAHEKFTGRCLWVFADEGLPDGSGLDLLRWIKDKEYDMKVGIITGKGDRVLSEAEQAHADLVVRKPVDWGRLLEDMVAKEGKSPRPTRKDLKVAEALAESKADVKAEGQP